MYRKQEVTMAAAFETHGTVTEGVAFVHLLGEIDLGTRDALNEAIDAHLSNPSVTTVILNMSAVTFLDSTGIGTLVGCHHRACENGQRLFIDGAHGQVEDGLTLTGVGAMLARPTDPND
jgi:anti-sigma B factor antagonist